MRSVVGFGLMFFVLTASGVAQERPRTKHPWLRRVTWAAACAASVWDAQTTSVATRRGAIEANGFLANAQGAPRWGRIIGVKAGVCAASFVTEEIFARRGASDRLWGVANTAGAVTYSVAAIHNLGIAARLARQSQDTGAASAAAGH